MEAGASSIYITFQVLIVDVCFNILKSYSYRSKFKVVHG